MVPSGDETFAPLPFCPAMTGLQLIYHPPFSFLFKKKQAEMACGAPLSCEFYQSKGDCTSAVEEGFFTLREEQVTNHYGAPE